MLVTKGMIDAVKTLHSLGFVHRDIKPQNFRIVNDNIKIIGFGLAREYRGKEQNKQIFEGIPIYASLKTLEGFSQSRRDDMEMIAYSLLVLKNRENPFYKDSDNLNDNEIKNIVLEKKKKLLTEGYIEASDDVKVSVKYLVNYIKLCNETDFKDEPRYDLLLD